MQLEDAIVQFLGATALWSTQWFNKIKFHVWVHLPRHIKRFGPAILFATETMESYNLVIRLRSVHSPRQAPSVDIARSFIHVHIVRHLVSGGLLPDPSFEGDKRRTAGTQVLALADDLQFQTFMLMKGVVSTEKHEGMLKGENERHILTHILWIRVFCTSRKRCRLYMARYQSLTCTWSEYQSAIDHRESSSALSICGTEER